MSCHHDAPEVVVESAGLASVQDLGRPGHGDKGIAVNGAVDRGSARLANALVGNAPDVPLLEATGSGLTLRFTADALVAVTGGDTRPTVAGRTVPTRDPFVVEAGASLVVPTPDHGWRFYVAVAGGLAAPRVLGSVSLDVMLGAGSRLSSGDRIGVGACVCGFRHPHAEHALFRLGARRPSWAATATVDVTAGPEIDEYDAPALTGAWTVSPQSDHVGLRVEGPAPVRTGGGEILSRGVPVGAVEAPPQGGLLILLYGRLATAGYPVPYAATTVALDTLGQLRPGATLVLRPVTVDDAVARLRDRERELATVAARASAAFAASGLADYL